MPENKTKPTKISVDTFLDAVADESRRRDAKAIRAIMERVSGKPAVMWGTSIVGFGRYRYKYASGHGGEMCRVGFSPRSKELVIYIVDGFQSRQALMDRLGKYRTGKSCLYIKRLDDIDEAVLVELIEESLAYMRGTYPEGA